MTNHHHDNAIVVQAANAHSVADAVEPLPPWTQVARRMVTEDESCSNDDCDDDDDDDGFADLPDLLTDDEDEEDDEDDEEVGPDHRPPARDPASVWEEMMASLDEVAARFNFEFDRPPTLPPRFGPPPNATGAPATEGREAAAIVGPRPPRASFVLPAAENPYAANKAAASRKRKAAVAAAPFVTVRRRKSPGVTRYDP